MKPYFSTPSGDLYHGDCLEVMQQLDVKADLCLTDPPYGIGADEAQNKAAEQRIKAEGKTKAGRGWKQYKTTEWDRSRPEKDVFDCILAVSKNSILWGGNYFADYLPPSMGWIVWDKGQRNFSLADGELAWTSFDKALRIFNYSRAAALQDGKVHPTQKPVALFKWCLQKYAKQGDLILDPFLGSGTTAIACESLGMRWIGIEQDESYCEIAAKRVKKASEQFALFE